MERHEFEKVVNSYIEELINIGKKNIKTIDGTFKHPFTGKTIPNVILKDDRLYPFCIAGPDGRDAGVEPRVKNIGHQLHNLGGLQLMQYVYHQIRLKLGPCVRTVNAAWDGIGTWRF
jgi:hypothetical protein